MRKLLKNNASEVIKILLKELNVKYTEETIYELKKNPYFPDLISLSQTLSKLNIENVGLRPGYNEMIEYPTPFLVHMHDNGGMFLVVKEVNEKQITFIVENQKEEIQTKDDFIKTWSGFVLLVNTDVSSAGEKKYKLNLFRQVLRKVRIPILLMLFFFILFKFTANDLYIILKSITSLIGLIVSVLLIIQLVDKNNFLIKSICNSKGSKKMNCSSILTSKAGSFLGVISWSEVGFVYFFSQLLILVFFKSTLVYYLGIISFLAFFYVFYSIFYQWKVARVWCKLCLFIQLILFTQALINWYFLFHTKSIVFFEFEMIDLIKLIVIPIPVLILTSYTIPLLKKYNYVNTKLKTSNSVRMQSNVFEMQLSKNRMVDFSFISNQLLTYGNKESKNSILIVLNPKCEPCIASHRLLSEITSYNENLIINEVFLIEKKDKETKALAVKMIEIYLAESEDYFRKAISDYYNNYTNKHKKWLKKYWKSSFKTEKANIILENQIKWCVENGITSTPKIIFNGRFLPSEYDMEDIEYLAY